MQIDPCHLAQQAKMPAPQPVGVGYPITAQALPQVFGFAHVKHQPSGIVHQVNARAIRQLPEKIRAQPFDQWSRIGDQQCLGRRHDAI
ncbi:MAG: hypothetical protein WCS42_04530 [Verrucomicrobiota bacterium]